MLRKTVLSCLCASLFLGFGAACSGLRGYIYDSNPSDTGLRSISGAHLVFTSEDGAVVKHMHGNPQGFYQIDLPGGSYRVTATAGDYRDYASPTPVYVGGGGYDPLDVYMDRKHRP